MILRNKKIALITHYGEDFYKSRVDFINFLEENQMDCISIVPNDEYRSKIAKLHKKVYYYKYSRNWRFVFSLISVFRSFVKILKSEAPDVLLTYKFFPNIVGVLAGRRAKIKKIVATVAGIGFLEKKDHSVLINMIFILYMKVLERADVVIAQNVEDKSLLEKYVKNPLVVMTNGSGVNDENLIKVNYDTFIAENGFSLEEKYITFCSRIVKEKGILELIDAYNIVSGSEQFPYDLIVAGWFDEKGLEKNVIEKTKKNPRIHVLGYQKNVANLLEISDVFILPSYYPEGVPRSLIEALAKGKIIITTDHKGCRETCIDGYNGYLAQPKSFKGLVEVFNRLAQMDDKKRKTFQRNSRKLFEEKFHRDVVFSSIMEVIN